MRCSSRGRRRCSAPRRPCRHSWRHRRSRTTTFVVALGEIARHRHAEAGGDRGRGVRGAERVVLALRRGCVNRKETARRAQRADAVAPGGDDLVRISLVPDVPHQPVTRGIEYPMQGDGELDDAEAGAKVAALSPIRRRSSPGVIRAANCGSSDSSSLRRSSGVLTRSRSGVFGSLSTRAHPVAVTT